MLNARYSRREIVERVEQVERLSFLVRGEVGSPPQAALRWVLDQEDISLVLPGLRLRPKSEIARLLRKWLASAQPNGSWMMRYIVAISLRFEFTGAIVSVDFTGCVLFDFLQLLVHASKFCCLCFRT